MVAAVMLLRLVYVGALNFFFLFFFPTALWVRSRRPRDPGKTTRLAK